jgi:hypothetical protein
LRLSSMRARRTGTMSGSVPLSSRRCTSHLPSGLALICRRWPAGPLWAGICPIRSVWPARSGPGAFSGAVGVPAWSKTRSRSRSSRYSTPGRWSPRTPATAGREDRLRSHGATNAARGARPPPGPTRHRRPACEPWASQLERPTMPAPPARHRHPIPPLRRNSRCTAVGWRPRRHAATAALTPASAIASIRTRSPKQSRRAILETSFSRMLQSHQPSRPTSSNHRWSFRSK